MVENWEFCNSTGVTRMIGFKAGLFNCRVAAYLNKANQPTHKPAAPRSSSLCFLPPLMHVVIWQELEQFKGVTT